MNDEKAIKEVMELVDEYSEINNEFPDWEISHCKMYKTRIQPSNPNFVNYLQRDTKRAILMASLKHKSTYKV